MGSSILASLSEAGGNDPHGQSSKYPFLLTHPTERIVWNATRDFG